MEDSQEGTRGENSDVSVEYQNVDPTCFMCMLKCEECSFDIPLEKQGNR